MRVNRQEFLRTIESVSPGLATKEILEQSTCFVFSDGKVSTFNDEVSASRSCTLQITGAVKAKPLVELLSKMKEDDIEIDVSDNQFLVKGKMKKAGIRLESEVLLPIEAVETPEVWKSLPTEFGEAVRLVHVCASKEESEFDLTCVHVTPRFLEACDKFQIIRYPIKTDIENEEGILIRASSLNKIVGFDMVEFSETSSWIHFRNSAGLVISCRRYLDQYRKLDTFISHDDTSQMVLPGGLDEVVDKANIFSADNSMGNYIKVELRSDRLMLEGQGVFGFYKEMKQVKYDGPEVVFMIDPSLLVEVSKKSNECRVGNTKLFIDTGKFQFATCTIRPEDHAPPKPVEVE